MPTGQSTHAGFDVRHPVGALHLGRHHSDESGSTQQSRWSASPSTRVIDDGTRRPVGRCRSKMPDSREIDQGLVCTTGTGNSPKGQEFPMDISNGLPSLMKAVINVFKRRNPPLFTDLASGGDDNLRWHPLAHLPAGPFCDFGYSDIEGSAMAYLMIDVDLDGFDCMMTLVDICESDSWR